MKDQASTESHVSRAGLKLELVCSKFDVNFKGQSVLDVGSSTGGFSEYALKARAKRVIAIELGTNQMANSLRQDKRIELHEKTDILSILPFNSKKDGTKLGFIPDIVLIDLSFVSLKSILPHIHTLVNSGSRLIVLVKPQFETKSQDKHHGIIKNDAIRRRIFKDFESWAKAYFVILAKADSEIPGSKGNRERFYLLSKT